MMRPAFQRDKAEKLISVFASYGINPQGVSLDIQLRDAAHEAHHALTAKCKAPWSRDAIHEAMADLCGDVNGEWVIQELDARAVERVVCQALGAPYDADRWMEITWFETASSMKIMLPSVEWITDAVVLRLGLPKIKAAARRILTLKPRRVRKAPGVIRSKP